MKRNANSYASVTAAMPAATPPVTGLTPPGFLSKRTGVRSPAVPALGLPGPQYGPAPGAAPGTARGAVKAVVAGIPAPALPHSAEVGATQIDKAVRQA